MTTTTDVNRLEVDPSFMDEVQSLGATLRRLGSMHDQKADSRKVMLEHYVDKLVEQQDKRRFQNQRASKLFRASTTIETTPGTLNTSTATDDVIYKDEREMSKASTWDEESHIIEEMNANPRVSTVDEETNASLPQDFMNNSDSENSEVNSEMEKDPELNRMFSLMSKSNSYRITSQVKILF